MTVILDAATEQFLQMLRAAGQPPIYELPIDVVRAGNKAASQQMARPPLPLHRVEDRHIPTPGGDLGVRIYWPRQTSESQPLPLVVFFHGGGFAICDLDTHDPIARALCRDGDAIVVNVDYRRSPEHKFPAAVEDAYAAVSWVSAHAAELGGDARRIAVAGDSAGGNLAAVICQIAKAKGGPQIAFQILIYPLLDMDTAAPFASRREFGGGDYFLSMRDMEWFNSLYFADESTEVRDPRASPLRTDDLSGLPPALVVTAGCDPLRDEGKSYADRLSAAGVPVEYRCFEGTIHVFVSFASAIPAGDEALALVAERLRTALRSSR
jgi:acetyl esterase